MKRLLALLLLLSAGTASADILMSSKSSYTITNDTSYLAARYLSEVIVSSASTNGNLKVYNSTYTTSGLIANISLGTLYYYDFNNLQVKGVYYVITGNTAAGVTIIYK